MKIEMDDTAGLTIVWVAAIIAATIISFFIYKYNSIAYEQGYTQVSVVTGTSPVWVKK